MDINNTKKTLKEQIQIVSELNNINISELLNSLQRANEQIEELENKLKQYGIDQNDTHTHIDVSTYDFLIALNENENEEIMFFNKGERVYNVKKVSISRTDIKDNQYEIIKEKMIIGRK